MTDDVDHYCKIWTAKSRCYVEVVTSIFLHTARQFAVGQNGNASLYSARQYLLAAFVSLLCCLLATSKELLKRIAVLCRLLCRARCCSHIAQHEVPTNMNKSQVQSFFGESSAP